MWVALPWDLKSSREYGNMLGRRRRRSPPVPTATDAIDDCEEGMKTTRKYILGTNIIGL